MTTLTGISITFSMVKTLKLLTTVIYLMSTTFSLLVSPSPRQPWLAVSTTNTRQVQVYNYETHNLKYLLDVGMCHTDVSPHCDAMISYVCQLQQIMRKLLCLLLQMASKV